MDHLGEIFNCMNKAKSLVSYIKHSVVSFNKHTTKDPQSIVLWREVYAHETTQAESDGLTTLRNL